MNCTIHALGDRALIMEFGETINEEVRLEVQTAFTFLTKHSYSWMVELVPSFTSLTVVYDPVQVWQEWRHRRPLSSFHLLSKTDFFPYNIVAEELKSAMEKLEPEKTTQSNLVEIPVCYEGDAAPDLMYVAEYNQLTTEEVIDIHTSGRYTVYMIGFAPGFPYMGGMSKKIATPRKENPRTAIPAGSVGIAGEQTGVYPIETPGGWQLIGKTPLDLFKPEADPPSMLQAGDMVKFYPISQEEYDSWEEKV